MRIVLTLIVSLLCCMFVTAKPTDAERKKFEHEAYVLSSDLIHNHTYDIANVRIADSLYAESVKMESEYGMMVAMRIKVFAYAGNNKFKEFETAVDEFMLLALKQEDYGAYYDGMSVLVQQLINQNKYTDAMQNAMKLLEVARNNGNKEGYYEAYYLIGQVFMYRGNFSTANKNYALSLKYIEPDDSIAHCLIYRDMSECYTSIGKTDEARRYAASALRYAPYDVYKVASYFTMLSSVFASGDMVEFRRIYSQAEAYEDLWRSVLGDLMYDELRIMHLASIGKMAEAMQMARRLENDLSRWGMLELLYSSSGDYSNALLVQKRIQYMRDSIQSVIDEKQLIEMNSLLGNAELKIKNAEARRNLQFTVIAAIVGALLLIVGFMWYMLRRRHITNKKLQQSHHELMEAHDSTKEALHLAEQANEMRRTFIENMSHEIRTPLNHISGFAQILAMQDMELDETTRKDLSDNINVSARMLTDMLANIILLSDYDSGKSQINKEKVSCRSIVSEAIGEVTAPDDDVKVDISVPEDAVVEADRVKAAIVMARLIANAVKFTHSGSISIGYTESPSPSFYVEDTGIGIPDDKTEVIFERFTKLDTFVPGAGLGLAVCRTIARYMGGDVMLDTSYGKAGSRFVFKL